MATARRVQVEITAQDKTGAAFQAVAGKFGNLQGQIAGLAASFSGVQAAVGAALGGAGLGALVTGVADSLDAINDLSDATGASVANVSRLESAVRRTGGSFDDASALLLKFNQALAAADAGSDQARVFEALGLSVAQLRKADPVEALLQTAQAFQKFGNSGEMARWQAVILGKTIGALAPAFKDLAERGLSAATVTDKQAEAADRYNKALARLKADLTDYTRTIGSQVLPQLAEALIRLEKMDAVFGSIGGGVASLFFEERIGDATVGVAKYAEQLRLLQRQREIIAADPNPVARRGGLAGIDAEIAKAEKLLSYYRAIYSATFESKVNELGSEKDPRRGRGYTPPPEFKVPDGTPKQVSEFEKYVDKLSEATQAALGLSQVEQARIDIVSGKLGKLTKAQEAQILSLAEGLDLLKAPDPQLAQFDDIERRRQAIEDEGAAIQQLVSASRGAQFDSLVAQTERIVARFNDGTLSAEDYARAIEVLGLRFAALEPEVQASLQQVSTFAEEASRNIQDALGDTLTSALRGDFDSIGDLWEDLLLRMVAQAASAQLNQYLFGAGVGSGGGVLGPVLGSLFGGFRANGGPVERGRAYVVGERGPEVIVPSSAGTVVPNGSMGAVSITYGPGAVVVGDIATQSQVRQALAAHAAATEGRLRTTLARNGMPVT